MNVIIIVVSILFAALVFSVFWKRSWKKPKK